MIKVRASVTVAIEIDATGGGWTPDVRVEQVYKQAEATALERLRKVLEGQRDIRIKGPLTVEGVAFDNGKDDTR